MRIRILHPIAAAILISLIPLGGQALELYVQDFEALDQASSTALGDDGWLVYGNVYTPGGGYLYGYGPEPAPNHELGFSQIVLGEGGPDQGEQVVVVFSDYENVDHANGNLIESNVYQEQLIEAADVGTAWRFSFQAKRGNIEGATTAVAFIKTLDPSSGYALTNFLTIETTAFPDTWSGDAMTIPIGPDLEGQLLQIGFANTATNYEGSGIFYDNVVFESLGPVDVPHEEDLARGALSQNWPNPFGALTRIEFSLERPTFVDLSVLDPAGRRVAVLQRGELEAGVHHVAWNGQGANGRALPNGVYWYTLKTAAGEISRRMVLTN